MENLISTRALDGKRTRRRTRGRRDEQEEVDDEEEDPTNVISGACRMRLCLQGLPAAGLTGSGRKSLVSRQQPRSHTR